MSRRALRAGQAARPARGSFLPVLGLIVVALVCGAAGLLLLPRFTPFDLGQVALQFADRPAGTSTEPVPFSVREGDTAASIGARLEVQHLINSADFFRLLCTYYGVGDKLKAGEYELRPNMKPSEILGVLTRGEGPGRLVTIPEGRRTEEVAALLADKQVVPADAFLAAARAGDYPFAFLADRPSGSSLEGYLFPESYRFGSRVTARDVVQQMLATFEQRALPELRKGNPAGLSPHEALTLASIVEREAVVPSERPTIASVYLNRLRQGIRLDADPTVQYALAADPQNVARFGWWKQDLAYADLDITSPYNTYRRTGLPPGPIANPGLASIQAVVQPANTDYLYFVARKDGSHLFARTLEEHSANVRRAQQE